MRLILKIVAAPFFLLLSGLVALLVFLHTLAVGVLGLLALLAALCGLFACFIGGDIASGVRVLILAALISPFGLPLISEWLIVRLDDLKYSLRCLIAG